MPTPSPASMLLRLSLLPATALLLCAAMLLPACKRAPDPAAEAAAAIAAVRLDDMPLQRIDGPDAPQSLSTASLKGVPYWLFVTRAAEPNALASLADWTALSADLQAHGAGAFLVLLTGPGDDVRSHLAAWAADAAPAPFPIVRADAPVLGALAQRAELRANPTAFLFSPEGALLRTVGGFPPPEHYLADAQAAAAGQPLPDHPAEGVLPEDNAP